MHFVPKIRGTLLDRYLDHGWYRMGMTIFTTHHITTPEASCDVWWIRYPVQSFELSKTHAKIHKAGNKFTAYAENFKIDEEAEALYATYRNSVDFSASPSIQSNLFSGDGSLKDLRVFDSHMVKLYDEDQLIAFGVFDLGATSLAGILNVYDPAYKKYSLGKLLILHKVYVAKELGYKYYYPGYISREWNKFDYKLFLGKQQAEVYIPKLDMWVSYEDFEANF